MQPASELINLFAAVALFALTHFAMSGFFRARLVSAMGTQTFLLFYSLVSLSLFGWALVAFDREPETMQLWDGSNPVIWALASVLTILSLAFLLSSFSRNPALPGVNAAGLGTIIPTGVFTITRHPMMWGIALWALAHIMVAPEARVLILMGGLILVALLGSHFQDKRKIRQNNREFSPWQRRTTYWPNLRNLDKLRTATLIALVVWFLATTVHWHFFGIPAGLWMWIG
ncbi:NnrU family protein [Novosphingobium sp. MMS21-SN21R]|uniref:NnrU family protein n=1 Tax=Novosphingobium sp. MMS21-SN21R TaxID=2969298 RepID=UPI002885D8B7|nr:NnrU family protein [Novosphingobium sp. MMS21-SN21R]MDT0506437.1 NnrU family protein [Novosphingobium sp. MMS21-SN21R]